MRGYQDERIGRMPRIATMTSLNRPQAEAHEELYNAGMVFRRKVMGDEYVDNQLAKGASEFMKPMQEVGWGTIWTRPGLELKQRSLINIALLASQGKEAEVTFGAWTMAMDRCHSLMHSFSGAVNNGASVIEIRETLLQTAVYCGIPTGMASFRVAEAALAKLDKEGKI
ncbi:hypothetical protein C0995_009863 [Termitomyces sp. Mi166|nr:hypothetical protein C0995_009863 [Termitomyces sp. Mi166\